MTFGTGHDIGSGVIVFEKGRIFGGDTSFYYVGRYTYISRDQTISDEVEVIRHGLAQRFIFPGQDGGRLQFSGQVAEPEMILIGRPAQAPQQKNGVNYFLTVDKKTILRHRAAVENYCGIKVFNPKEMVQIIETLSGGCASRAE